MPVRLELAEPIAYGYDIIDVSFDRQPAKWDWLELRKHEANGTRPRVEYEWLQGHTIKLCFQARRLNHHVKQARAASHTNWKRRGHTR